MTTTYTTTVRDAARLLGVSRRRVLQMIESKRLRARQINPRLWLVSSGSIEREKKRRLATLDGHANVGSSEVGRIEPAERT